MPRFFSLTAQLLRARMKARYWRKYAQRLELQLEGEKRRNTEREDVLNTAYLRVMGLYGLPARSGPAPPAMPLSHEPVAHQPQRFVNANLWDQLTDTEKSEFATNIWRGDGTGEAELYGKTLDQAREDFAVQTLRYRMLGNVM